MTEVRHKRRVRRHRQRHLAQHLVGERQHLVGIGRMDLRVQRQVRQGKGQLPPVERAFRGEAGGLKLVENILRNLLVRITIIRREAVQHPLVPRPVLQHLRRGLHEVARHARAREARVFRPGQNRVHAMPELVENRHHLVMRQQRRLVRLRRREVADQRAHRALVQAVRTQLALGDAKLREVIVFALTRKHVQIEQPQRLARRRVGDRVHLQIVNPLVRRLDPLKFQPEDALVNREHAIHHRLVGEINPELLGVHVVFGLPQFVGEIAPVPYIDDGIRVARILDLQLPELLEFGGVLRLQSGLEIIQKLDGRGGIFDHARFGGIIRIAGITQLVGDVVAQDEDFLQQRNVRRAGQIILGHQHALARVLPRGIVLHHHVVEGDVRHERIFIRPGLDALLRQKILWHPRQLGLGEFQRLFRLCDIVLKIRLQSAQLLALLFHQVTPIFGQC